MKSIVLNCRYCNARKGVIELCDDHETDLCLTRDCRREAIARRKVIEECIAIAEGERNYYDTGGECWHATSGTVRALRALLDEGER